MSSDRLTLPLATQQKLSEFRQRVRLVKVTEGVLAAACGLLVSWLAVLILDRFIDTPRVTRAVLLLLGCLGGIVWLPVVMHRWVWRTRRLENVAVILKRRFPALGDQLQGIIELIQAGHDPRRSRSLAVAAIEQVDAEVRNSSFQDAVPDPRHRFWGAVAAVPALTLLAVFLIAPAAGTNSLLRWLTPWREVDRFTFAQLAPLPDSLIVPHGESFQVIVQLDESTQWRPTSASARCGDQIPVVASRDGQQYAFQIPPQTESTRLQIGVGDCDSEIEVLVKSRPELTALTARISLPEYLQRSELIEEDVRGGAVSILQGASAEFDATINRSLASATFNAADAAIFTNQIRIPSFTVLESSDVRVEWEDELGLTSKAPFMLRINSVDDAAPGIMLRQNDPTPVVLSTEVVSFQLQARDDYGVRAVGLEWHPQIDSETDLSVESQSKTVADGGSQQTSMKVDATFCAETEDVRPQTLELRAWAEDFRPGRGRVYSPSIVLHILTPDEHAAWMTGQLRRWASLSEDVYEEELRLHDVNRSLRELNSEELSSPETQQKLQQQAAAERANGQRLVSVARQGEMLIRRAMQNPEMRADHLEIWAESLQQLKMIADSRMPSVADMLTDVAQAATSPPTQQSDDMKTTETPFAGNDRGQTPTTPVASPTDDESESPEGQAPAVVDVESGFNPNNPSTSDDSEDANQPGKGRLTLPSTTLQGGPPSSPSDPGQEDDAASRLDRAVQEQADLLAQFQSVRDELQSILDDLENSTFVKRFKAASRHQMEVAADLNRTLQSGFGIDVSELAAENQGRNTHIADRELLLSRRVAEIESDLRAYFDRSQEERFGKILEEMQEVRIVDQLVEVGTTVRQNRTGEAISRSEFWCDTLDRWAEEIVVPSRSQGSQGSSSASLPPAIVLEVMRILKAEVDLREETRSTEQSRSATPFDDWRSKAISLSQQQEDIQQRVNDVMSDILALPSGVEEFGDEVELLSMAGEAMYDATGILFRPETGAPAIAAETEAIEILLRSKRCNPNAGGGGGTSPGGGGEGETATAALALYGPASDPNAVIEFRSVTHATATELDELPEEFREGLDTFFNAVEQMSQSGEE